MATGHRSLCTHPRVRVTWLGGLTRVCLMHISWWPDLLHRSGWKDGRCAAVVELVKLIESGVEQTPS